MNTPRKGLRPGIRLRPWSSGNLFPDALRGLSRFVSEGETGEHLLSNMINLIPSWLCFGSFLSRSFPIKLQIVGHILPFPFWRDDCSSFPRLQRQLR